MSSLESSKLAFVFPGQGSQVVGMGKAWAEAHPEAQATFDEADRVLPGLTTLCWEGPVEELQLTANTQPAILATSIAIYRAVAGKLPEPAVMAGHSLGEYSALVASGALKFSDALKIVRRRGELMQEAVPAGLGAMAAVLGLEASVVEALVSEVSDGESLFCGVANYNEPRQTVIAGHREAVERAAELAKERGARRALMLPVSAPFHSALMAPAREGLTPLLESTAFSASRLPVVTNVDAQPVTEGKDARDALIRQIDGPVRWVESVDYMISESVASFVEVGPGAVLTGLVRRISRDVATTSLAQPEKLAELLA